LPNGQTGARDNWYKHLGGQILLVTGGKGYYQEESKSVQIIKEGDIVKTIWMLNIGILPTSKRETSNGWNL